MLLGRHVLVDDGYNIDIFISHTKLIVFSHTKLIVFSWHNTSFILHTKLTTLKLFDRLLN